jgi:hypothetical protein
MSRGVTVQFAICDLSYKLTELAKRCRHNDIYVTLVHNACSSVYFCVFSVSKDLLNMRGSVNWIISRVVCAEST